MLIGIVTPLVGNAPTGNLITAARWAGLLRGLGHQVEVGGAWAGEPWEVLIALHARKSADSVRAFRQGPIIVMTTGTDVYPNPDRHSLDSLRRADAIVVLQANALFKLPESLRRKAVVIEQSAAPVPPVAPREDVFEVCLLAHLRPIKDPLVAVRALVLLPERSRVRLSHAGSVLDSELGRAVRAAAAEQPRYDWLGQLEHGQALELLARSRALLLTSHAEGGGNVLCEAVAAGRPILSTDIDASRALLGADHPGLFPVADAAGLARLLERLEREEGYRQELASRSVALQPRVAGAAERQALLTLLQSLEVE